MNRQTVGALLVGAHCPDGYLRFCGTIGAGLGDAQRRRLIETLKPLCCNTSPFVDVAPDVAPFAHWVRPELIGDVEYREFRGSLRHPSWRGLRADLSILDDVRLPA